jgi:hypothetical protein
MRWRTRETKGVAGENNETVTTSAGVEVPASAVATCQELVAILREACRDLPMELEPGDFLGALDRHAEPEGRS